MTTTERETPSDSTRRGAQVSVCVLLAGGLRPSPLVLSTGRNVLDLSFTETRSVLDLWLARLGAIGGSGAGGSFPVRVIYGGQAPAPTTPPREHWDELTVEREPSAYRGPAGVLRDVCEGLPGDATILVGESGRFMTSDLSEFVREHARRDSWITVGVNPDGSPGGVFAVRGSALELVNRVGFMDLKEQWLNKAIAAGVRVMAHPLSGRGAPILRTRLDLLHAARIASGGGGFRSSTDAVVRNAGDPPAGGGSVVCEGARVASSAIVHDSVLMPGSEVGERALVVRSVVAPGVRVEPEAELIDVVAGSGGVRSDEWSASPRRMHAGR